MLRLGLRLVLLAVILCAVGWLSVASVVFEVIRVVAIACLAAGFACLLLNFVRTPDPASR